MKLTLSIIAAISSLLLILLMFTAPAFAENDAKRVVSIGGSVTEIIYAMGEEDRLIARDSTSLFPTETNKLPDIGYIRRLSPEGVLSVNPDLIITLEGAGPPEAVSVLKTAKVVFESIPESYDAKGIISKINAVGRALNRVEKADLLAKKVAAELKAVASIVSSIKNSDKKNVLFVLSARGGNILAAGTDTSAAGIIKLAGGINAITGFKGYKALSDESIVTAKPDVILMMNRRGSHSGGKESLLAHPAIALTPAARTQNIIMMDGLFLLGFGPRTASAVKELAVAIYGSELMAN